MEYYQNNFVKSRYGYKSSPVCNGKKGHAPKKQPMVHEKCPPLKPSDEAKVTHVSCDAFGLDLEGNELNVPVINASVALAEIEVAANVEAHIKLPTPATEIKNIRKNVSLTQCKAVPSFTGNGDVVSLFISGIIHKNIQYSDDSGYIRDYAADVPFHCTQTVPLVNPADPEFPSVKNTVIERRFINKKGHGADRCTHGQFNFEVFNEAIDCKLLAAVITEVDLLKDFDKFGRFNKITEKMEVVLFLKLLQDQQVAIGDHDNGGNGTAGTTVSARLQALRNRF
ncbi:CsxC family protein [Halalkalibacter kiskunsagensis]|uniref:CsxC family protein n=1 Tax=Halalkalibacter kiskunsagensis TaxID=1548599 RepID=A0ABV6K9T5_9BACI